jgi:hypothetical protein
MIARYLNLPHRQDRREATAAELRRANFTPRRIEGVKLNEPKGVGCSIGHLWLIADALSCGEEFILVFEDDFCWRRLDLLPAVLSAFMADEGIDGLLFAATRNAAHSSPDDRNGTRRIVAATNSAAYILRRRAAASLMLTCGVSIARAWSGAFDYCDYAFDFLWSVPMQRGHWRICSPSVTGLRNSPSDIE